MLKMLTITQLILVENIAAIEVKLPEGVCLQRREAYKEINFYVQKQS